MKTMISTCLAEDETGKWLLSFEFEDHRHLYVRFKPSGAPVDDLLSYISVDDFLAWRPRDALHKQAIDACVEWLAHSLRTARRAKQASSRLTLGRDAARHNRRAY